MNGLVKTSTRELVSAGFVNLLADAEHELYTDVPSPAYIKGHSIYVHTRPINGPWMLVYDIEAHRVARIQEADLYYRQYVYDHYEPHRQSTFSIMLSEALKFNRNNRFTYVMTGVNWCNSVIAHYFTVYYPLIVATTKAQIDAVVLPDLAALFDSSDPKVSIAAASQILD